MPAAERETLRLGIRRISTVVLVSVHGDVDAPGSALFRRILEDLIDGQGNLSIVVDVHDARVCDSSGVSTLAWAVERAARRGGTLAVSGAMDYLCDAPAPANDYVAS